jgi:lamin tail-like protein
MKYSNLYFIAGILIIILVCPTYMANGQTVPIANHVVINEVELNPSDDYTKNPSQWVELYNPTSSPVNIGGWTIGATTGLKQTFAISQGTMIQSQQFIVYHYVPLWFPNVGASIQLKNSTGSIIDQTPPITDQKADANTWQRMYDGYNTGSSNDWIFKSGTPGFTNGQPPTITTTSQLSISVSTDKQNYIYGDTVNISGKVSQIVQNPAVTSIPQTVNLVLSGPHGFLKTFSLYPGTDLKFSTSVKVDQVLGFFEGTYTISGTYGGTQTSTTFSLGSEAFIPPPQAAPTTISLYTNNPTYQVSQPIVLQGLVSNVIPLAAIQYKVYDPTNVIVSQGNIFPDSTGKFTTVNQYQNSAGSSGLLVNGVNPIYGIYKIVATYGDASNFTNFTLIPTNAQINAIIISTDKKVYAPGDTVVITGSTNFAGLQNIGIKPNLQIIRTSVTGSSGTIVSGNRGIVPNSANIDVSVNVLQDNSFTYNFVLPSTSDSFGNYRAIVSIPKGVAQTDFVVVQNPSSYKPGTSSAPFSILTDKSSYALGDHIIISGLILNPVQVSTQNAGANVQIQILNSTGGPISSGGTFKNNLGVPTSNALTYFAFPDANGNFQIQQTIQAGIYSPGTYTLKASYSNLVTTATFTVFDPLQTNSQNPISASTDKNVYGLGDTVNLNGKISALTGTDSYTLTLIKPSGNQITFPLKVNNGQFSWTWDIPSSDSAGSVIITTDRTSSAIIDPTNSVYGIYRININSAHANSDLFFQVSKDASIQNISPIVIQTDKTDYLSTDVAKIWGQVIPTINAATKEANAMVQVLIYSNDGQEVYRGSANVNQGGQFYITVPFHTGVWKTGTYKVYAQFLTNKVQSSFKVTDPFTTSSNKLQLFMTTNTDKYLPGQTVLVTGRTSYIISLNNVDLAIGLKNDTIISEGEVVSKKGTILPKATIPFDQFGSFSYDYTIPSNTPVGSYTILAIVPFGVYNADFNVVSQIPTLNSTNANQTQTTTTNNSTQVSFTKTSVPSNIGPTERPTLPNMLIQKFGKISDSVIPISFTVQTKGNLTYYPRELDGLLRLNPGDDTNVAIKITSQDGTCIIGPDQNCLVTKSTVQSGALYQTVIVHGTNFLVGYTGTGNRLQQFTILPVYENDSIPDAQWNVDIIKKDQVTRFYYQVISETK